MKRDVCVHAFTDQEKDDYGAIVGFSTRWLTKGACHPRLNQTRTIRQTSGLRRGALAVLRGEENLN